MQKWQKNIFVHEHVKTNPYSMLIMKSPGSDKTLIPLSIY